MKKLFIIGFVVLLAVALAVPALADSKFTFRGDYRIQWYYRNNANLAPDSDLEAKQSFIRNRWRMYSAISPTDQLTLYLDFMLRDSIWGSNSRNAYYGPAAAATIADGSGMAELAAVYMDIKTAYGIFRLGRQWVGPGGLIGLGYAGSVEFDQAVQPFDALSGGDRMMWIYTMGPWSLWVGWDKGVELDSFLNAAARGPYDADFDDYFALLVYKAANWGANCSYVYFANHATDPTTSDWHRLNPSVVANFGPVAFHGEGIWVFAGKRQTPGAQDIDLSGWGVWADVSYNFGPGVIALEYFYISGDDGNDRTKITNLQTSGTEHSPFLIVTDIGLIYPIPAAAGAITGSQKAVTTLQNGLVNTTNYQMIGAYVDYTATEALILHAAVGYFTVNEPGTNVLGTDVDSYYGTELNLGVKYKIMKNLSNELMFGYFMPGDYFKFGLSNLDLGEAYAVRNTLTLKY